MRLHLLHTNDFHGTMTPEVAAHIAHMKQERDALYFDSGDCIKAGNLGIPLKPEPVWQMLHEAGCDASVMGNRESHPLASAFKKKLAGVQHPIVCANLIRKSGSHPFKSWIILEREGLRIGVFGVMVPMVTRAMKTQAASAYLWDPPIETAQKVVKSIRNEVDCLIALTHIGHREDLKLAASCPEIDIILGGHSHTILEHPLQVGETWVCQGGSHGRFIGVYEWDPASKELTGGLQPLK